MSEWIAKGEDLRNDQDPGCQELIRCKECKYYPAVRYADDRVIFESYLHCSDIAWESGGEGFCSWAERRTDETDI